ncbi:MAG: hypothetical protein AAB925_02225 [Patescibacteria group bacterium]
MAIPLAWQEIGILPEHLAAFRDLLKRRDNKQITNEQVLEALSPELKVLGPKNCDETYDPYQFVGCVDGYGIPFTSILGVAKSFLALTGETSKVPQVEVLKSRLENLGGHIST